MSGSSRRHLLAGAAGLVTLTAGCLDGGGGLATSPGPADDDENATHDDDSGDDDGGDDATEDDDPLESTTVTFQHGDRPEDPTVDLLTSEDQANRWSSDRSIAADTVSEFIDETDFETSGVIALEAGANTTCYELAVESVGLEDETVTVRAEGNRESTGGEDQLCAQQLTAVGALVRASVDAEQPSSISATIVDADGSEHERGASVSSASASESTSTNRSERTTGSSGESGTDAASD